MYRKLGWIGAVCAMLAVYAAIWPRDAASPEEAKARAEGRTVIVYWDRHTGHEHEARRVLIDEFNRSQDKVYVRALPLGLVSLMEKLLTAVAGGAGPDVCSLDGSIMAELTGQGCFLPLESLMARSPSFSREGYLPKIWEIVAIDGHVWGLPTTTDSYCLLWNKQAFRKAGLDPERPPQTFTELQAYAARLTIQSDHGIEQIGFLPWHPWDLTYMYGLLFGGNWYDESAQRMVCAKDPALIRMLYWQRTFARDPHAANNPVYALDPERIMTFQKGFGAYMSASNPFYSGKVAMITEGEWQATFIPKYAPDLDWGVAPIPTPDGEPPREFMQTCLMDCVPRGCKHLDAVWTYLEWFYSPRPNGGTSPASDYSYAIHNIPVRRDEIQQERFTRNPKFKPFIDVLLDREIVVCPVSPVTQFMMDEIDRQRERVIFRKITPEAALEEIQRKVNLQVERVTASARGAKP